MAGTAFDGVTRYRVTFHRHSCFQVEDARRLFLFDWFGETLPELAGEKEIYVLNSHKHRDHYDPALARLADRYEHIRFVWPKEIRAPKGDARFLSVGKGERYCLDESDAGGLEIETLPSTDSGVAFLLRDRGRTIYHAGDLNWWSWSGESYSWNRNMEARFKQIMRRLEGLRIDIAFVPLDPRLEERFHWGFDYFLQHTDACCVFPMHLWGELDTVARWKALPTSAPYRARVRDLEHEGEQFEVEME